MLRKSQGRRTTTLRCLRKKVISLTCTNVWLKFGSSQPFRIKATANQIIEDLKEALLTQHSIEFQSLATHNITIRQGDSLLDPGSSVPQHTMSNNPLTVEVIEGPQGSLIQIYFQILFFPTLNHYHLIFLSQKETCTPP